MRKGFLFLFLLFASAAYPCSCAGPIPVCSAFWTTPLVFVGHVISQQPNSDEVNHDHREVHFSVAESFRGSAGQDIIIRTPSQGSMCGFKFEDGSEYLVYAYSDNNEEWWTNTCTRTHKVESVNDDPDVQWMHDLAKVPQGETIFGTIQSFSPGGRDVSPLPRVSPLPDIKVTVTGPISKTIMTDTSGQFRTTDLPPGDYTVSAVAPTGYAAFSPTKVSVNDRGCAEVPFTTRLDGHIRGHVYFSNGMPAGGLAMTAEKIEGPLGFSKTGITSSEDGSFDFSPLAPGSYVFGVNIDFSGGDHRYYRKAFYPGVTERSQAALVQVGHAKTVDNLRFVLPEDLPCTFDSATGHPARAPSVPILTENDMWEIAAYMESEIKETDSDGRATLLLRKGGYYNVWAVVNLPDVKQECAEPVGVLAEEGLKPIILIVSHSFGNCSQFKKHRR